MTDPNLPLLPGLPGDIVRNIAEYGGYNKKRSNKKQSNKRSNKRSKKKKRFTKRRR